MKVYSFKIGSNIFFVKISVQTPGKRARFARPTAQSSRYNFSPKKYYHFWTFQKIDPEITREASFSLSVCRQSDTTVPIFSEINPRSGHCVKSISNTIFRQKRIMFLRQLLRIARAPPQRSPTTAPPSALLHTIVFL